MKISGKYPEERRLSMFLSFIFEQQLLKLFFHCQKFREEIPIE